MIHFNIHLTAIQDTSWNATFIFSNIFFLRFRSTGCRIISSFRACTQNTRGPGKGGSHSSSQTIDSKIESIKINVKISLKAIFFPRRESYFLTREVSLSILNKETVPTNHLSTARSMLAHQVQGASWSRLLREVMQSPSVEKHKIPTGHGPEEPAVDILLGTGTWTVCSQEASSNFSDWASL